MDILWKSFSSLLKDDPYTSFNGLKLEYGAEQVPFVKRSSIDGNCNIQIERCPGQLILTHNINGRETYVEGVMKAIDYLINRNGSIEKTRTMVDVFLNRN